MSFHGNYIYNYLEFMQASSKEYPQYDPYTDQMEKIAEEPYYKFANLDTLRLFKAGFLEQDFKEMNSNLIDSKSQNICLKKKVK
jgi:hypothetical protein